MTAAWCTNCSADKRDDPGMLPAKDRYTSPRIFDVAQWAESAGERCFILSGRFGLLDANHPIPFYDHLLVMEEVPQMTMRVTRSMMEAGLSSLRFVCRPLAEDPQLKPYMDVMHGASLAAGIALRLVDYPAGAI